MLSSPLNHSWTLSYSAENLDIQLKRLYVSVQGPGLFEPIHGSAPDIAGQVKTTIFR